MSMGESKEPTEIETQNKICTYFEKKGYLFFRTNNTPQFDRKLNSGYGGYRSQGRFSAAGLSDIILIDKEEYGMAVFFEVKTLKGRQSPDQKLFEKRCWVNNCKYYVVRSLDEVKKLGY